MHSEGFLVPADPDHGMNSRARLLPQPVAEPAAAAPVEVRKVGRLTISRRPDACQQMRCQQSQHLVQTRCQQLPLSTTLHLASCCRWVPCRLRALAPYRRQGSDGAGRASDALPPLQRPTWRRPCNRRHRMRQL